MSNVTRFPFQLFEAINAHGYSMSGDFLHVKVLFVRYVEDNENFDCVIECEGIKSFSNTSDLWRDGDPVPSIDEDKAYVSCIPSLTKKEIVTLQEGDELVNLVTDAPATVVGTKEAPVEWRMKDTRDNSYFNVSRQSMTLYGWK